LKRLPVHYLKIDGRFVRRIVDDRIAESIVSGIARAARTLGVSAIAEHVENSATADKLRELDVDFGQGFHFGGLSSRHSAHGVSRHASRARDHGRLNGNPPRPRRWPRIRLETPGSSEGDHAKTVAIDECDVRLGGPGGRRVRLRDRQFAFEPLRR